MDLDSLVQEKIEADTDFQSTLEELDDDAKLQLIEEKKREITPQIFNELAEKAKKNEELANNYKIRAEKAESAKKEVKEVKASETVVHQVPSLSTSDLYALMTAKVDQEDVSSVEEYAAFKKISVAEALRTPEMNAILATRKEQRTSAQAAATTVKSRSSSPKVSDDKILNDFKSQGKIPEPGTPEAEALFWASRGGRKQ